MGRLAASLVLLCLWSVIPTVGAQPLSITVAPGAVGMTLQVVTPGDSLRASDGGSRLTWYDRRGGPRFSKVTVSTVCPGQRYALRVTALGVVNGTPTGTVELIDGLPERDLVLNIAHRVDGSSMLRYDAAASPADGRGPETHVVTYTFTRQ
ncbi:MAG: hypothetical protein R3181_01900 [Rubricoccaceae bacterium]|nr:hypothetical protein [Rubricoccaceae bacterium]